MANPLQKQVRLSQAGGDSTVSVATPSLFSQPRSRVHVFVMCRPGLLTTILRTPAYPGRGLSVSPTREPYEDCLQKESRIVQSAIFQSPGDVYGATECIHHWIIEPPSGPKSLGRCKHCGEHQEFINSWVPGWTLDMRTVGVVAARRPSAGVSKREVSNATNTEADDR